MVIFVDTSAFYALMTRDDPNHQVAMDQWTMWKTGEKIPALHTNSYVVLETISLIQNRLGLKAVRIFQDEVMPLVITQWVNASLHAQGVAFLLATKRRKVSLVDCMSFVVMRHFGIDAAFAFDQHFAEQGFRVFPEGQ